MLKKTLILLTIILFLLVFQYIHTLKKNTQTSSGKTSEEIKTLIEQAKQGDVKSQIEVGLLYFRGQGVERDYQEAVKWYTKSAEQGYADAQFQLGQMYSSGEGVIEDYIEAYKWYLLAGMNGEEVADVKRTLQDKMTPEQIAQAQKLAKEFVEK